MPGAHDLVIGAAPWSDPDLSALEELAQYPKPNDLRVNVFDVDSLSCGEMTALLPGIRRFMLTPVVLQYRNGRLTFFGHGQDAVSWLRQL